MRVRHLTATLALSALALTGCGGDTEDEETTTSTVEPTVVDPTSSTGTAEESPTSETDEDGPPEEAKADTKEGAEAFAKWYWEESGDALTDGDTSGLEAASAPDCKVCGTLIETAQENEQQYGRVASNPYRVSVVRSAQEGGVWRVKLKVEYDRYEYVKGGETKSFVRANEYEVNPRLVRRDASWQVEDWLLVQ